jgi:hypothetical protein
MIARLAAIFAMGILLGLWVAYIVLPAVQH